MSIIDNVKDIAELIKKLGHTDLCRKILDLEEEIVALTRQIRSLEEENEELKKTLSLIKKMKSKKPFYFQDGDPVPFCPRCWEKDKNPVHLIGPVKLAAGRRYGCPNCKEFFIDKDMPSSTG
jgi:hypothetical protein